MKLPSQKFIIVVLGTVVIVTVIFFVFGLFNKKTTFTQESADVSHSLVSDSPTFGNLIDENMKQFSAPSANPDSQTGNLTENLSKELITSLILGGNTTVSKSDISDALNILFEKSTAPETPRIYSQNNIKIADNSELAFKSYGNDFMNVIEKHAGANAADALGAFEQILETRNESSAKILQRVAEEYRKMESDMLSIETPQRIAPLHLDFINGLRATGNAVSDMEFALSDPVRATLGLSTYIKQLDRAWAILNNIYNIFKTEKIEFSQSESGYRWNNFQ
ncbi:MAG: hypothetical protein HYT93_02395 [Parcubacteria group bacterium]|nr:hypothetical protein [Parcubacteria group bacterium]